MQEEIEIRIESLKLELDNLFDFEIQKIEDYRGEIKKTLKNTKRKCNQIKYDKAGFNAINIMHMSESN